MIKYDTFVLLLFSNRNFELRFLSPVRIKLDVLCMNMYSRIYVSYVRTIGKDISLLDSPKILFLIRLIGPDTFSVTYQTSETILNLQTEKNEIKH